jgi:hypothetical protein
MKCGKCSAIPNTIAYINPRQAIYNNNNNNNNNNPVSAQLNKTSAE